MFTMFSQLFAAFTRLFSAFEKSAGALDNLASWSEETSASFLDEARYERQAKQVQAKQQLTLLKAVPQVTTTATKRTRAKTTA